jgi:hypothetical protein
LLTPPAPRATLPLPPLRPEQIACDPLCIPRHKRRDFGAKALSYKGKFCHNMRLLLFDIVSLSTPATGAAQNWTRVLEIDTDSFVKFVHF